MAVVVIVALVLGVTVLVALYTEPPPQPEPPPAIRPAWDELPSPEQIRRRTFPTAVAGYDRDAVDAHLSAVADAFVALHAAAVAADRGWAHRYAAALAIEADGVSDPPGPASGAPEEDDG